MKKILVLAVALSGMASVAMAQEPVKTTTAEPVKLTEAEMDSVAGGAPVIDASDLIDVGNVQVEVPVNAAAAVNVLGGAAGAGAAQLGRIGQGNPN